MNDAERTSDGGANSDYEAGRELERTLCALVTRVSALIRHRSFVIRQYPGR